MRLSPVRRILQRGKVLCRMNRILNTLKTNGDMMTTLERLGPVTTSSQKSNELIYVPPSEVIEKIPSPVLVYFGGDVQDYPEVMTAHRDHGHYVEWSLTNVASLMAKKFPSHHIFVVKPSRMERKTFSCYDNFVESNSVGAPTHCPGLTATPHLADLISEGLKRTKRVTSQSLKDSCSIQSELVTDADNMHCTADSQMKPETEIKESKLETQENACDTEPQNDIEYEELTLIGFSKGCVVLNQMIIEFNALSVMEGQQFDITKKFINKIRNMYWLDGGHAGGSKTWITDPSVLKSLALRKNINIHIHVTPYQVHDDQRPWIRKECKAFYNVLRRNGANINYTLHCEDETPSLLFHFKVLNLFT